MYAIILIDNLGRPCQILSASKNINSLLKNPAVTQICLRNESTKIQPASQDTNVEGLLSILLLLPLLLSFHFVLVYN